MPVASQAPPVPAMSAQAESPAFTTKQSILRPSGLKTDPEINLKASMPGKARTDRPPKIAGYEFFPQSRGFTCREIIGRGSTKKRIYLGFLSGKKWQEMKSQHSGPALRDALKQWIAAKRKEREQ